MNIYSFAILILFSLVEIIPLSFGSHCGKSNGLSCTTGYCCSKYGYCGKTEEHCGKGCQINYGKCHKLSTTKKSTKKNTKTSNKKTSTTTKKTTTKKNITTTKKNTTTTSKVEPTSTIKYSVDGRCGPKFGNTVCKGNKCCSKYGWCGIEDGHCGFGCQVEFGRCDTNVVSTTTKETTKTTSKVEPTSTIKYSVDGRCGPKFGNTVCKGNKCCSKYGWCGIEDGHCGVGCQVGFGRCNTNVVSTTTKETTKTTSSTTTNKVPITTTKTKTTSTTSKIKTTTSKTTTSTTSKTKTTTSKTTTPTTIPTSSTTTNIIKTINSSETSTLPNDKNNENLIPYSIYVKVNPTEKNKETLKYLKEKYPSFFENFLNSHNQYTDEYFLDKLAMIDLSNKAKSVMDENLNLFSESQLREFKERDKKIYYIDLPSDDSIAISSLVNVSNYDFGFEFMYSLYIYANEPIIQKIVNEISDNVVSYNEETYDDLEGIDDIIE